jgi:HK97 family phage major capsid protein
MYHQKFGERAINTTDDSALVPEDFRPGSFIDVLRNSMSVMQAGATVLNGLSGNVDIPKKLTASSASWVSTEGGNAGNSEPTFGNVTMTPKDIAVYTDITRRARQQMSPDVEALIRMDITMAIALGLDLAALEGSGSSGQPRGVLNTVGINKPTAFAAANPTYAEVVALETAVADDNALMGNLAYIIRTNMAGALKTTEKFSGTGMTVWEPGNTLNGYNAIRSNQGTDGNLYFGNWSDLLIGFWSGLDLQFDYAALALSGGLRLIAFQTADVAVRHAQSFAYNNDTV